MTYIAPDIRRLAVPLVDLHPAPNNARRHVLDKDVPVLMASLERFGQRKVIVGKRLYQGVTNAILAGNGTLLAATRLGWTHLAVAWADELSDEEAEEYALVDNRTAELSEWDLQVLAGSLGAIKARGGEDAVTALGWRPHEAAPLLAATWAPAVVGHLPGREVSWRAVSLSLGQWMVLELAIQRIQGANPDITEGRAVELLAADFLGGPGQPV